MSSVIKEQPPVADPVEPPAPPAPAPAPDPKPSAPPPTNPPVLPPEPTYSVKLAADSPLDAKADVDKIVTFAKAHKLTNEQAQALMKTVEETGVGLVARQQQANQQALETAKVQFLEESKAHPTIGGANFDNTVRDVERALGWAAMRAPDAVKRFRTDLGQTPYGNHPGLLEIFAMFGKALAEDRTPIIAGAAGGGKGPKDLKEALYGPKTG